MHKPRIIILTTAFYPLIGGAEIAVQEIIKRLGAEFEFVVVTARIRSELPARDIWEGVPVIRVGWGRPFDKVWLLVAAAYHVARLRTGAHTRMWAIMASYAGAAAWIARRVTRVPYLLTLQEGDDLGALEQKWRWAMRPFGWIFRDARAIQVIAPFLGDWARAHGARAVPVVIPNGVPTEDFVISEEQRAADRVAVRRELGIPPDAPTVLTVSRLVEKNGVGDLIAAVADMPAAHLIIAGDGHLREVLKAAAAAAPGRIHFVGSQRHDAVKRYAAASDVFCRPALSEGQGIVFLEAMQMGLPVVGTRVGGIPSMVDDGHNGLLVEPHEPAQVRAAIERFITDPACARVCVDAGYKTAARFNWQQLAPQIGAWLKS